MLNRKNPFQGKKPLQGGFSGCWLRQKRGLDPLIMSL